MSNIKNKQIPFIQNEIWEEILNSDGYFISNFGRVKRKKFYKTKNETVEYLMVQNKRGKK